MKYVALFRYHKDIDLCNSRIENILRYNPQIEVHGIYGGRVEDGPIYEKEIIGLTSNYIISDVPDRWKWQNFDFILRKWFIDIGNQLQFDRLVLFEWDYLLFDSVENTYKNIPNDHVGMTGITPLEPIQHKWYWTTNAARKIEYRKLVEFLKSKYNNIQLTYACLLPGFVVNYDFLDKMREVELPEYGNDELRFPIYAQIAGIPINDTGFYKRWFSKREFKYFNCNEFPVKPRTIKTQLQKRNGRRAFHPVRIEL